MDGARNRVILGLCGLFLSGCASEADPVVRLLQHRGEPASAVGGDLSPETIRAAGLVYSNDKPDFWIQRVGDQRPETGLDWAASPLVDDYVLDFKWGGLAIWRRAGEASVETSAIDRTKLSKPWPENEVLGPVQTLGWWAVRGEWVAEAVIQVPERMPMDLCLDLHIGETQYETGAILGGRQTLMPGTKEQLPVRHRIWLNDVDWSQGPAHLVLLDCSNSMELARKTIATPEVERHLDSIGLRKRWAPALLEGQWKHPARGARGLRRTSAGLVPVSGPPYPRLRKGFAWPVLVVGPVDPTEWRSSSVGTPEAPLAKATSWLDAPGLTVMGWNAPATRLGNTDWQARTATNLPRRMSPQWLPVLQSRGVDVLSLTGPHVKDVGPLGEEQTAANSRALGLGVIGPTLEEPHLFTYQIAGEERVGALVGLRADLKGQVSDDYWSEQRRVLDTLGSQVDALLVQIHLSDTVDSPRKVADRLASPNVDAIWFTGGTTWGPVDVIGHTTIVLGVPEIPSELGGALRWYLGDGGVIRLDIVAVTQNSQGQWTRPSPKNARSWFDDIARRSAAFGTYVRTGNLIATVDVAGHWPSKPVLSNPRLTPPLGMRTSSFEPDALPVRCEGDMSGAEQVPLGASLQLESWSIEKDKSDGSEPFLVRLQWARTGDQLPPGDVEIKAAFSGAALRQRYQPCEGSWGFERFELGQKVEDKVWLWPPSEAQSGESEVWVTVRLAGSVQRTPNGERKISIGKIRLDKSEESR